MKDHIRFCVYVYFVAPQFWEKLQQQRKNHEISSSDKRRKKKEKDKYKY